MYRIGIIGSENSHAMAFSEIFNNTDRYPDMRVVGIYGEDAAESRRVAEKCGVELIVGRAGDMLGRVDAMMVTSRNGALHADYARPFIEAGLPTFIDKPIANGGAEAYDMLKLARDKGVPVMGGSSVKFTDTVLALKAAAATAAKEDKLVGGHVWAPVQMVNPYGNFYFYASHLMEVAMMIFGFEPGAVQAVRREKGVGVVLAYDRLCVQLSYTDKVYGYGATVLTADGADTRAISLEACYDAEVEHFADMLRHGKMPQTIEEMALPVFALNAVEKAYETGEAQAFALPG